MRFTRHRKGIRADVDRVEAEVLTSLAQQLLEVVEEPDLGSDPLAELVGLPSGDVDPPDNPVLARLLPSAYRDDDAAAGDFRRYTDGELRRGKRTDAQTVLDTVPAGGGRMDLDRDQADRWLGALNDMRLALGTVLDVDEETDVDDLEDDDPALQLHHYYGWLGWLQESLLSCLEPRLPS